MTHSNDIVNSNSEINWTGVIKKEARGINDADFGKVHEVVSHFILTEKGLITKEKYYFPTGLVKGFDGDKLRFDISEEEADAKFKRETTPSREEYAKYDKKEISRKNTMVIEEEKAERKAQAIVQQSEDKARKDADKRYEEITREAEDKARQQAEVPAQAIVKQSEESSDQLGFEDKRASNQGMVISMKDSENYTKADGNYEGNKIYDPYVTSMNLLNNYSKIWATWYNEVLKNITGVRDFWTYNNDWSYNNLPSKKIDIAG
jgi:hypothetical protein